MVRDTNGEDRKPGRKLKKRQEEVREQTAFQKQAFVLLWTVSTTGRNALKWEVTGAGKVQVTDLK